jgi:hypothetical protein
VRCLGFTLIPPYYPVRDHVFSFDLQGQEEGEGLVPNKVRGCVGGGADMGKRLGKSLMGATCVEEESERHYNVKKGPGWLTVFPLLFLPSVSNMEEPRYGKLCCTGEADGEEWRDNWREGAASLPPASAQGSSSMAKFLPTFPSQPTEHSGKEKELILFSSLYTPQKKEK